MSDERRQQQQNRNTLVSLSDLATTKFIDVYYKVMDYQRNQITNFYRPISKVQWNGREIEQNQLQPFWSQLPATHHTLISVNAQPLSVLQISSTPSILITVNGKVSYLGSKPKFFSQTFVISAEPAQNNSNNGQNNAQSAQYYIVSDIFRLQQDVSV